MDTKYSVFVVEDDGKAQRIEKERPGGARSRHHVPGSKAVAKTFFTFSVDTATPCGRVQQTEDMKPNQPTKGDEMKTTETKEVICCECGCITIKKEAIQFLNRDGKPSNEWTCESCIREIAPGFAAITKAEAR